jgi:hypothetical protein
MPLYDYCFPQGHVFEQLATIAARAQQPSPACGQVSDKIPSWVCLAGRADPGPSTEQMPQTWRGAYEGEPEYLGQLRRRWRARRKLEDSTKSCAATDGPSWPTRAGITAPRCAPGDPPAHP